MTALYRKYRPQTFAEVVGQEAVVRTLSNAIEGDKIRQAYLFAGPRGTGKTSLARILAKSVNCKLGPTPHPDNTCHACVAISNGTSLDVIEMDATSQRGIDDIREIRERVVLQPVEGKYKVYILDEAHQLTDAAWNALLKLIEEPPPHLLFIFCTTDLAKVLPTVRSRCQTFVFQRPRLPELVQKLRLIADAEEISVPDTALALIARGGRGAYRDAESTLDQLASATAGTITVQDVLGLLGTVEDEILFRLCDLVVDGNTAGALVFLEELSEQGQDLGRLVTELLEHLRHLMLVQHMGEVPDTLPVTEEARERLREQAQHLGPATVLRLIDLLHVAVEDMRQGGDPRLPLELALVKVTRASSDLSREALAYRIERLEAGAVPAATATAAPPVAAPRPATPAPPAAPAAPSQFTPPPPRAEAPVAPVPAPAAIVPPQESAAPAEEPSRFAAPAPRAEESAAAEAPAAREEDAPPWSRDEPIFGGDTAAPAEVVRADNAPAAEAPPVEPEPAVVPAPAEPVFQAAETSGPPRLALDQLQEAWRGSVLPALEERAPGGRPAAVMLANAHPVALEAGVLTLEFAKADTFQRAQAEDPKNIAHLVEALYGVTGHRLDVRFTSGEGRTDGASEAEHPTTEEGFIELMKTTFDAQELDV